MDLSPQFILSLLALALIDFVLQVCLIMFWCRRERTSHQLLKPVVLCSALTSIRTRLLSLFRCARYREAGFNQRQSKTFEQFAEHSGTHEEIQQYV